MRKYEIMFIVRPTVSDDEKLKVLDTFKSVITTNGGIISETKDMGKRDLAYEIKDFKSGYYYMLFIESNDDKAIKEFDRLALINNDIVRHLVTKK